MRLEYPLAVVAVLIPVWIWWTARDYRRTRAWSSAASGPDVSAVVWRVTSAALLVLSAAGLAVSGGAEPMAVMVAVDRSRSVPRAAQARAVGRLDAMVSSMRDGDSLGAVSFAATAAVERRPRGGDQSITLQAAVPDAQTDIGAALRVARAQLPPDGAGRIVLISDGIDTAGGAEREGRLAAGAGVPIDIVPPATGELESPLRIVRMTAPPDVSTGEPYRLSIEVAGTPGSRGTLIAYRGDEIIARPEVLLGPEGTAGVVLEERQMAAGAYVYRAAVETEDSNPAGTVVIVEGQPAILYVSESQPALRSLIIDAGFRLTHARPADVPTRVADLSPFVGIVLDDIEAGRLPAGAAAAIAEHVETAGGGLLVLGSPRSLALDGFPTTALERVLPVDLRPRGGQRGTLVELVIVVDKSGSMSDTSAGVPAMETARQAVLRAAEVMPPGDSIGVLAFVSEPQPVVPLGAARDLAALRTALDGIVPGGATSIAPALRMALGWLRAPGRPPSAQRHILLISDGRTSVADAEEARRLVVTGGAEVSVVSIGPGANRTLLEDLARSTGGRAYFPNDLRDLPAAVAREVARTSGGGVVEERFVPRASAHPILEGMRGDRVPPLEGYVVGALKPHAEHVLASHLDDPILSVGRAGLGRVAVFTADLGSRWSAPLKAWPDSARLWSQTLRWLSRRHGEPGLRLQIVDDDSGARLRLDADAPDGTFIVLDEPVAVVEPPAGVITEVTLVPVAPGRYEAVLPAGAAGPYVVALTARDRKSGGERRLHRTLYWAAAREHRRRDADLQLLGRLASSTGGRFLPAGESPFDMPRPAGYRDVSKWAAAMALVMFVLDIVARERVRLWSWMSARRRPEHAM